MHARASVFAALPLPRHAASAGADLATPHTGLRIPVLLIEGVRTHAHGISTGAVAVFRACRPAPAAPDRSAALAPAPRCLCRTLIIRLQ